jgi:hypothetical protein
MNEMTQRAVVGVDFSGAAEAGGKIWIALGIPETNRLTIEGCLQAKDLPQSSASRGDALGALMRLVARSPDILFGFDFPFSLPQTMIAADSWVEFATTFGATYPTDSTFLDACRAASPGREMRRRTDRDAQTPFAPYNLRVYRQTYYGIRDVLGPLAASGVCVLPMMDRRDESPWVIEICPASTLKLLGLYKSYKHKTDAHRDQRATILQALEQYGVVIESPVLRERVLADANGDALDSVIAAYGTWRTLQRPDLLTAKTVLERLEGRVYF